MKSIYTKPEMNVISVLSADILTSSPIQLAPGEYGVDDFFNLDE